MNQDSPKYTKRECKHHGVTKFALSKVKHYYVYKCKECNNAYHRKDRLRLKAELIEAMGGQCAKCGYDKSHRALHFHHLDPKTKLPGLAYGLSRAPRRIAFEEIKKCILVCANCHAELEDDIFEAR